MIMLEQKKKQTFIQILKQKRWLKCQIREKKTSRKLTLPVADSMRNSPKPRNKIESWPHAIANGQIYQIECVVADDSNFHMIDMNIDFRQWSRGCFIVQSIHGNYD